MKRALIAYPMPGRVGKLFAFEGRCCACRGKMKPGFLADFTGIFFD
jgi:hypothetical protein